MADLRRGGCAERISPPRCDLKSGQCLVAECLLTWIPKTGDEIFARINSWRWALEKIVQVKRPSDIPRIMVRAHRKLDWRIEVVSAIKLRNGSSLRQNNPDRSEER